MSTKCFICECVVNKEEAAYCDGEYLPKDYFMQTWCRDCYEAYLFLYE